MVFVERGCESICETDQDDVLSRWEKPAEPTHHRGSVARDLPGRAVVGAGRRSVDILMTSQNTSQLWRRCGRSNGGYGVVLFCRIVQRW